MSARAVCPTVGPPSASPYFRNLPNCLYTSSRHLALLQLFLFFVDTILNRPELYITTPVVRDWKEMTTDEHDSNDLIVRTFKFSANVVAPLAALARPPFKWKREAIFCCRLPSFSIHKFLLARICLVKCTGRTKRERKEFHIHIKRSISGIANKRRNIYLRVLVPVRRRLSQVPFRIHYMSSYPGIHQSPFFDRPLDHQTQRS